MPSFCAEPFSAENFSRLRTGVRRRTVAVLELRQSFRRGFGRAGVGDALVRAQALMFVGNVLGGNADVEPEIQRRVNLQRRLLALELVHRLFQQPDVHVEPDRADVAVLLAAQNIARAAQFQIERGDLESGAQIAELLERGQPLARDLAQLGVGRDQQVRIRSAIRPPHSARATDTAPTGRSARRSR